MIVAQRFTVSCSAASAITSAKGDIARTKSNFIGLPLLRQRFVSTDVPDVILWHPPVVRWRTSYYSNATACGLCYGGPNTISNTIDYAMHRSHSHDAVVRVYDDAGNVIATHEHAGEFVEQ
jgi:hypothetical protein